MKNRIKKLTEKQQREFALICASRAVDRVNIPELNEYFTLVCFAVEADMLEETKKTGEYRAAYWVADQAAYRAAYWVAYRAAYWAAYWVADQAANRAAYWAAYRAADRKKETKIQNEILDNMLGELERQE